MEEIHEGLLSGHNYTNGEHYYTVTVTSGGVTDEPVFHLEADDEEMQAIINYNGYSKYEDLMNSIDEGIEVLLKEDDGLYVIAVDEMS